jgi:hypothetical protein
MTEYRAIHDDTWFNFVQHNVFWLMCLFTKIKRTLLLNFFIGKTEFLFKITGEVHLVHDRILLSVNKTKNNNN